MATIEEISEQRSPESGKWITSKTFVKLIFILREKQTFYLMFQNFENSKEYIICVFVCLKASTYLILNDSVFLEFRRAKFVSLRICFGRYQKKKAKKLDLFLKCFFSSVFCPKYTLGV